jgi:ERCC4-related helicase
MSFEERRKKVHEKSMQKRANREKVSKEYTFKSGTEEANFKMTQEYNGISFSIFRKAYNQVRGKEVSYGLDKQGVEQLRDYLNNALENWDEWNKLDK